MNPSGRPRSEAPAAQREGSGAGPDAAAVDVASPCVSLCEMSRHNAFCVGCFRTLDEIASWSVLDAQAKRAIVAALPGRRAAAAAAGGAAPEPPR